MNCGGGTTDSAKLSCVAHLHIANNGKLYQGPNFAINYVIRSLEEVTMAV